MIVSVIIVLFQLLLFCFSYYCSVTSTLFCNKLDTINSPIYFHNINLFSQNQNLSQSALQIWNNCKHNVLIINQFVLIINQFVLIINQFVLIINQFVLIINQFVLIINQFENGTEIQHQTLS